MILKQLSITSLLCIVSAAAIAEVAITPGITAFPVESNVGLTGTSDKGGPEMPEDLCCTDTEGNEASPIMFTRMDFFQNGVQIEEILDTGSVSDAEGDQLIRAEYYATWACPDANAEELDFGEEYDLGTTAYTVFSATASEIGFAGDHLLTKYEDDQLIDYPDGSEPVWNAEGGLELLVAYTRASNPVLFGKFETSPIMSGTPIDVIAFNGSTEIGRVTGNASEDGLVFSNLGISEAFDNEVKEVNKTYGWGVETSENGKRYSGTAGSSSHPILLVQSTPAAEPLVDQGVKESVNATTPSSITPEQSAEDLMKHLAAKVKNEHFRYNPNSTPPEPANLKAAVDLDRTGGDVDCVAMATLLKLYHDAQSSGGGNVHFVFGGSAHPSLPQKRRDLFRRLAALPQKNSIQMQYPKRGLAEENPHFEYHAVLRLGGVDGVDYDPVYGFSGNVLDLILEKAPTATAFREVAYPVHANPVPFVCGHAPPP